jgi:hypothetical protein
MKHPSFLITLLFSCIFFSAVAQTDGSGNRTYTKRDSLYLAKLNSNGNLMIAGGVGLCAAGGYLIYQGIKVYNDIPQNIGTPSGNTQREQNKKQGTIYLVAAGLGIAGGIVLTAFGARNKIEFKQRKKAMEANLEFLPKGQLGVAFNF